MLTSVRLKTRSRRDCSESHFTAFPGSAAVVTSIGVHYSMLNSVAYQGRGGAQVELLFEIVAMHLGSFGANPEAIRDFLTGRPLANEAEYLSLAPSQQVEDGTL